MRATRFRLFRWKSGRFELVRKGELLPARGGFEWGDNPASNVWVERFGGTHRGRLQAFVNEIPKGMRQVDLEPTKDGYRVSSGSR